MENSRPNIPAEVRLRLRQEAGFGCCFCGHPFIEYHHIIPWAKEQLNRVEHMMVVCGNHHHLCTVGALGEAEQRRAKSHPANVVSGELRGLLYVNTPELKVKIGGNVAIDVPVLLSVDEQPIVKAVMGPGGRVLISAVVHNKQGAVIAQLVENEWISAPDETWDFECYPKHATVRSAPREISFNVDCRDAEFVTMRGQWWVNGNLLDFAPSGTRLGNDIVIGAGSTAIRGQCLIAIRTKRRPSNPFRPGNPPMDPRNLSDDALLKAWRQTGIQRPGAGNHEAFKAEIRRRGLQD